MNNSSPTGLIFQIQRWSLHDGDGIRSTVFLKGCPLRCAWCANPESWSAAVEKGFGQRLSVAELMKILRRDEIFYRESGGGVTFSGGEPLAQPDFLRAALTACRRAGYHTALESCALAEAGLAAELYALADQVFVDLKHLSRDDHRKYTGQSNELILANIQNLLKTHPNVTVRMPLMAGVNDQPEHIRAVAGFLKGGNLKGFEFMPYHNLGEGKYRALGQPAPASFSPPTPDNRESLEAILRSEGLPVI